jgi:hypothetical protein
MTQLTNQPPLFPDTYQAYVLQNITFSTVLISSPCSSTHFQVPFQGKFTPTTVDNAYCLIDQSHHTPASPAHPPVQPRTPLTTQHASLAVVQQQCKAHAVERSINPYLQLTHKHTHQRTFTRKKRNTERTSTKEKLTDNRQRPLRHQPRTSRSSPSES